MGPKSTHFEVKQKMGDLSFDLFIDILGLC
jgi:hypothetical protein